MPRAPRTPLEIVIADTGDDIYNSAVFLSSLQGSSASAGGGISRRFQAVVTAAA